MNVCYNFRVLPNKPQGIFVIITLHMHVTKQQAKDIVAPGSGTKTLYTAKSMNLTSTNTYYNQRHNNLKLQEIHPTKGEPLSAADNGCSPTLAKQPKLDFWIIKDSCRLVKLVAGYEVDEMLPIYMTDSSLGK